MAKMIYTEENYDHKQARIIIEGEMFGHIPVTIDLTLGDEDSPNSAGVVVDAIRAAYILKKNDRAHDGKTICAFMMKSPPIQMTELEAINKFNEIINFCI